VENTRVAQRYQTTHENDDDHSGINDDYDNYDNYYDYNEDYEDDDMIFDWACTAGYHQSLESQSQVFHDRRQSTNNLLLQRQQEHAIKCGV